MDNTIPMLIFAGFLWYLVFKMTERNSKAETLEKKIIREAKKLDDDKYFESIKAKEYMRGFNDGMNVAKKSADTIDVEYEVVNDTRLRKR